MRYAIRCVGRPAVVILEPLVKQIVHIYVHMYQHPCFLYLGSILVDEFAPMGDGVCTQGLLDMLGAFIQPTFRLLERENGLRDHPDTVDDFFRLCLRYLQRMPLEFLQSACVNPIMQCAVLAAMLDHRDAHVSVMKYLGNLLGAGRTEDRDRAGVRQLVCGVVEANVDALMSNLLSASVFNLHSYMLPDVADVMLELKLLDTVRFLQSLKVALDALPKQNSNGHVTVTQVQLNNFHDALTL